jgi:8-oxo-dGTP pyrophosphatase MutT (NUDIX family)
MRRAPDLPAPHAEISPPKGSEYQAAVAVVLWGERGELLLIRRAEDPRDPWSGHMALPGGRHEKEDHDLLTTAIRETEEEVGLCLDRNHFLGALPPVRARSRAKISPLSVAPFVFRLEGPRPLTTPNYEVAEVIWLPLSELTSPERKSELTLHHEGKTYNMPAIQVREHKIWGLTYGIISNLLSYLGEEDA